MNWDIAVLSVNALKRNVVQGAHASSAQVHSGATPSAAQSMYGRPTFVSYPGLSMGQQTAAAGPVRSFNLIPE